MLTLTFLLLALLTSLATSFPTSLNSFIAATKNCPAKLFNRPWLLTGITIYNPAIPSISIDNPAWMRFNFIDYNDRLQLETVCYGNLSTPATTGQNGTRIVTAPEGYYITCADEDVSFKLMKGGLLMVERWYKDRCLGKYPYNSGIAFGNNNISMPAPLPSTAGALTVQDQMFVQITSMA